MRTIKSLYWTLQKWLLQLAHVGHPGIVQMKRHFRTTFWWLGLNKDCEHMVCHCQACQNSAESAAPAGVPPTKIEHPSQPWYCAGLDIAGPYDMAPTIQRFIITIIDHHSRYPECLITNDITSSQIIHWLRHPCMLQKPGSVSDRQRTTVYQRHFHCFSQGPRHSAFVHHKLQPTRECWCQDFQQNAQTCSRSIQL